MAAVYTAALNKLLKDENRCVNLAGSKVVYWYDRAIPRNFDPIPQVRFGAFDSGTPDDEESGDAPTVNNRELLQAEYSVRRLHESIRSGERPDLADATYFSLTLSGNSGRVVVRELMQGRFDQLVANIVRWFDDLSIVNRFGSDVIRSFKFNAVLAAPFRELKDAPAQTAATLWHAALHSGAGPAQITAATIRGDRDDVANPASPIPAQVMVATLRRTTIDIIQGEPLRHARYGLLKASVNRLFHSSGVSGMSSELKPVVDDLQQHPAYICGRVMGVLARIQKKAMPDVKAGVVERFYAAAMVTPALVLGRLVRNAEVAHIPAIRKGSDTRSGGLAAYFQNLLADAWNRLRQKPPTLLTLEEQTLFAIGYYHQLAERKAKLADGTTIDVADNNDAGTED
jgi:CRISPR-associated protein Csd1